MKQLPVLLILILSLGACSKDGTSSKLSDKGSYLNVNFDTFTCPTEGLCEFTVLDNSSIELNTSSKFARAKIAKGHKVVFQYQYTFNDKLDVSDDEYVEIIMFEIDPSQAEFEYTDESLKYIKATGAKLCYCDKAGYYALNQGLIKGKKLTDGSWDISIYVVHDMYDNNSKMISNNFSLQ